ncbi:sulfatase [candidate division CSSED10-310 bacterium]|uniref:Sulfatase n=1 Tax=candidate division CSSED10-310 bacterium TaxID=2855610 RepID=A0ABV6Z0C6_UNCC1
MVRKHVFLIMISLLVLISCRSPQQPLNKHWMLFTLDTLRQDHVGAYGHSSVKTPILDQLARQGVIFTDGIAESSWTIPSHASLLTSQFPRTHGATWRHRYLDDHCLTAAEILRENGFTCGAAVAARIVSRKRGFEQGFHFFADQNIEIYRSGNEVTQQALSWFSQLEQGKFFFWAHYFDPHMPFNPPYPYHMMYEPSAANDFDAYFKIKNPLPGEKRKRIKVPPRINFAVDEKFLARGLSLYHGEITYLDKQIEKIIRMLKQKKLFADSVITFVADHGEYLGEDNNHFEHGTDLGEPVLKIPYLMTIPTLGAGHIITQPVQLTDILPTVLNLLDLSTSRYQLAGRNLKPLLYSGIPPDRKHVFSELFIDEDTSLHSIRDSEMKLVLKSTKNRETILLSDLDKTDLIRDNGLHNPDTVQHYNKILQQWMKQTKQYVPSTSFKETEEMKQDLRVLGYVD